MRLGRSWPAHPRLSKFDNIRHFTLSASVGTFTTTGQNANLVAGRKLAPAQASYTTVFEPLSNIKAGRKLAPAQASYTTVFEPLSKLARNRVIGTAVGTYTTVYEALSRLIKVFLMMIGLGSFSTTFYSAILKAARRMGLAVGSFATTGYGILVKASRKLLSTVGLYTTTGEDATLTYSAIPEVTSSRGEMIIRRRRAMARRKRGRY